MTEPASTSPNTVIAKHSMDISKQLGGLVAGGAAVEASSASVEKSVKTAFYTRPPLELLWAAYS